MKRRIVVAFLVAFALWPGLHRVLVARWDMNPWKGAGWAMYARPHFPYRLAVRLELEDGEKETLRGLEGFEQVLAAELLERRFVMGRLASPERLARAILARRRDARAVEIELRTRYLDPETATLRRRVEHEVVRR